jgi:tetratricopeptide (TPR) repeat protein
VAVFYGLDRIRGRNKKAALKIKSNGKPEPEDRIGITGGLSCVKHTGLQPPSSSAPSRAQRNLPLRWAKAAPHRRKAASPQDFLTRYHAAYALIYDQGDYEPGITSLRTMGYDDNADVATLIGYASRKLGRYDDAKYWYDKALAVDPNHAVTWSYYGMWHAEQGNLLKAKDDLEKVRLICGSECKPYVALKEVIDGTRTY